MKKIISYFLSLLVALPIMAGPVSKEQAKDIAAKYLQQNRVSRGVVESAKLSLAYECLPKTARAMGVQDPLYYIFNCGEQDGFLVVSGDDRMTPVVGYVDQGSFVASEVPEGLRWWMNAMEETMLSVTRSKSENSVFVRSDDLSGLKKSVAPLVKVNWAQQSPYNDLCPIDKAHDNQRSLVGCTAVAMSQVLSKWKYPAHGSGIVNYTTDTHRFYLNENLDSFVFEWDKMLPSYITGTATDEEKKAVAQLMYACGLAIQMDYCAYASGAFVYADHLEKYFGIDPACNDIERIYFTKAEWDNLIKKELSEGRPVIYVGFSMDAGHTFVCDGYNEDGLFHINWGWDGSLNGYFALAELNSAVEHAGAPTTAMGSFNLDQSVVYGIQPKVGEGNRPHYQLCFASMKIDGTLSKKRVGAVLQNLCADGNGFRGSFSLGIYDKDNNFVGTIKALKNLSLNSRKYFPTYPIAGPLPDDIADGVYTLRPVYKEKGADSFEPMRGRKGSSYVNYFTMKVEADEVTLSLPEVIDAKISLVSATPIEENCYAGFPNGLDIVVRNDGALYDGPIILSRGVSGEEVRVYDNSYILEPGEERHLRVLVNAPEGVDKDVLSLWIAKTDDDIFYGNGFEYLKVGNFEYNLSIPTPGQPVFQLKNVQIVNRTAYLGQDINVKVNLQNDGGFYANDVFAFVFPEAGGSGLTYGKTRICVDKGQTVSFDLKVPTTSLSAGKYFLQFYYLNEQDQYAEIMANKYFFTIKDSGNFPISNDEGYGVSHVNYAFVVPEGLQCGVVSDLTDGMLKIDYRYQSGDVVPAGTPLILKGARKSHKCQVVPDDQKAPVDNLLRATVDEKGYTYAGEGYKYYVFDCDESHQNYGFYLAANDGAPYRLRTNSCYLAIPAAEGGLISYPFNKSVMGIGEISITESSDRVIYTLSGVQVGSDFSKLPKGIYIVDGKKIVK